jgi:hypothetical protein
MSGIYAIQQEALRELKSSTTWLQGVGAVFGKPAGELRPGDVVAWNFGHTSHVSAVIKETAATITVEFAADEHYAQTHQRTFKKGRVVAVQMNGRLYVTRATKDSIK